MPDSKPYWVCMTYEDVLNAQRKYRQKCGLKLTFSQCIFQKKFQMNKTLYDQAKKEKAQ